MAATTGAMIMTAETAITSTTDAEPILPQHRFDEAALEHYLKENIPDLKLPITISQFIGGMSNPTFMITDARGQKFVILKKPPGKLLTPEETTSELTSLLRIS